MNSHQPQASDLMAFAFLLGRGFLEWQDGRLVHHPGLEPVRSGVAATARPWGKSDDALLRRMVRKGVTIRQIAKDLGRSASFVEARLAAMRKPQAKPHWTARRLSDLPARRIKAAIKSSGTWTVAGEKLGFRWGAVREWARTHDVSLGKPRRFSRLRTPARVLRLVQIRKLLHASFSQQEIADRFGVSVQAINRLVNSAEYKRLMPVPR